MRDTRDNSSLSTFKSYSKKQVFSRFKSKMSSFLELLDLKPIEFVILMIFLAFVFFLYLINLDVQRPYDYDEGVYLLTSQMFREGFIPYSQLFASQPPLLLELIKLIAPSFKNDLFGSRFSIVLLGIIGLLATALCTNTIIKSYFQKEEKEINLLKRSFPIVLTVLLLGIGSHFWFYYSRVVLPNIPEASFTVLAFWFFLQSFKTNKSYIWAFLAGTSLSIGMFFKLFGAIPFLFILIYYMISKKNKLKAVLFTIGFFVPFLMLFNYDVPSMVNQIIYFHIQKKRDFQIVLYSIGSMGEWLITDPINIVGLLGLISLFRTKNQYEKLLFFWTWYNIVILWFYSPLFPHHLVHLVPFSAILASLFLLKSCSYMNKNKSKIHCWLQKRAVKFSRILKISYTKIRYFIRKKQRLSLFLILFCSMLLSLPIFYVQYLVPYPYPAANNTAEFIRTILDEDEYFITDGPSIAYLAERLVPPFLVDISQQRIYAEHLQSKDLIALAVEYNITVILYWTDRLVKLDEWNQYVQENYQLTYAFSGEQNKWIDATDQMIEDGIANRKIWISI